MYLSLYCAYLVLLFINCCFAIGFLSSDNAVNQHHLLYAIFLLAVISFLEQTAIIIRTLSEHHMKEGKVYQTKNVWMYVDWAFGLYYVTLLVLTGRALSLEVAPGETGLATGYSNAPKVERCFATDMDDEPLRYQDNDVFCLAAKWMTMGLFLRLLIRFLFCSRLALHLLADHLADFLNTRRTMTLASLITIIRITEDLDHGALNSAFSKIPEMVKVAEALNKNLKDQAERLLAQDMKNNPKFVKIIKH